MSAFKDMLAEDLTNVFINADEFADEHEINGETILCVVQSPTEQEKFLQGLDYRGFEGIHGQTTIVHVKKELIGEVPAEGEVMTLDGEPMVVDSCVDDMGLLSITLHFNHA
ncbi:hypothetical protein [Selenomonas sp. AE3005]|uniref:hypothetical protein n=1 Tax=Selenomonas sp. AE3005 TaxID=1485543 RepID=UPI0025F421E1|nr:hypothetical protein [Selenomonas sp. AE3005]